MGSARVYGRSQVNSIFLLSSLLTFLQTPTTRTRTSQHHSSTRTAKRKPSSDLRGARYSVLPKLLLLQYGRWVLTYTKKKKKKKNVPASKENPRDKLPPPYVQNICVPYIASHVEVYSANAVPGGSARAPFQDPASALYPLPLPRGPMGPPHPPIIHTGGHLVPPLRRSARGQAGLHSLLLHMGAPSLLFFSRSTRGDKKRGIEGN